MPDDPIAPKPLLGKLVASKDLLQVIGIVVAITLSLFNFWQANIHTSDRLRVVFTGPIDFPRGPDIDRIAERFAVFNTGTRDALLTDAELLIWNDHNTNHGPGFHWDAIPVRPGEAFPATVIRPGQTSIVSLPTDGHAQEFFSKPIYATRIDDKFKRVVFGVKLHSVDGNGDVYTTVFPYAYFKVALDYTRGPTEGAHIDYRPHSLFVSLELNPENVVNFTDELR